MKSSLFYCYAHKKHNNDDEESTIKVHIVSLLLRAMYHIIKKLYMKKFEEIF